MAGLSTIVTVALLSWLVLLALACLLCRLAAKSDADDRAGALIPERLYRETGIR